MSKLSYAQLAFNTHSITYSFAVPLCLSFFLFALFFVGKTMRKRTFDLGVNPNKEAIFLTDLSES